MTTPPPRSDLKRILAGLASVPLPYVVWSNEQEPGFIPPANRSPTWTVTGATNTAPVRLTVTSADTPTAPTGCLYAGARVVVSGITGNLAANGPQAIDSVDANSFNLTGTAGSGAYTGGGTVSLEVPLRWAWLRVKASRRDAVGWDSYATRYNADGSMDVTANGRRRILLSVDCFSLDPTATVMADDILEDVRTKIWHPEILDALNSIALVAQDVGSIIDLPTQRGGRTISAAHMDLTVALATTDVARYPAYVRGWIAEVTGTGTIDGTIVRGFDVVSG